MNRLVCSLFLIKLCGIAVNASDKFLLSCSPYQLDVIQDHYHNELRHKNQNIIAVDYNLKKGQNMLRAKFQQLEEKVSKIQLYEKFEIDVNSCFNINAISFEAEKSLNNFQRIIKDASAKLVAYVQKHIGLIHRCAVLQITCEQIEFCCSKVLENFNEKMFEDGIQELGVIGERFLEPILNRIDHEISSIKKTADLCMLQHHQIKDAIEQRRMKRKYRRRRRRFN